MTASPKDVQSRLDTAVIQLGKTTATYPSMVKKYGSSWQKWPKTSAWYVALAAIAAARAEAGELVAPNLQAEFSVKEG